MRFCYVDETGFDGVSATALMVGVVCDAQRLARAQTDLSAMFSVNEFALLRELKGRDLYRGKKRWYGVPGADRHAIVEKLVDWVVENKHQLTLASTSSQVSAPVETIDTWRTLALHIVLQLQRDGQTKRSGKGRAVVVFDENKQQVDHMAELLAVPPGWSDDYYSRDAQSPRLDQIIDSAFTAKSHHVGLIQLADLYAYLFFRFEQLSRLGVTSEYWDGESETLGAWIEKLSGRLLLPRHRWNRTSESGSMRWYLEHAPPPLVDLGR